MTSTTISTAQQRPDSTEETQANELKTSSSPARNAFRRIRDAHTMVAELRAGDGIDPREERRNRSAEREREKPDYAVLRLASEVATSVRASLSGATTPILSAFEVSTVTPGKGNHFVVHLYCVDPSLNYDPAVVTAALNLEKGVMRAELAQGINRKRVPDLRFDVAPPGQYPTV